MAIKVEMRKLNADATSLIQTPTEREKEKACFGFLVGIARLKSLGGVYRLGHDNSAIKVSELNIRSDIGKGRTLTIALKKDGCLHWDLETHSRIDDTSNDPFLTYPEFVDFLACQLIPGIEKLTGYRPRSSDLIAIDALDKCEIDVSAQSVFQSIKRAMKILPFYLRSLS